MQKELSVSQNLADKTALVVEGGAMRSIYAAGVLDTLLEQQYDPFDFYIGVSGGALNLSSFVAGQQRRNYRIITRIAARPEFIDFVRLVRGGSVMDLDWLWESITEHEPLDLESAVAKVEQTPLFLCCTRLSDGEPLYLKPDHQTWFDMAKGSCAIPLFYRQPVFIQNERVMDGAIADPIPVREAYERGARHIVVVRTNPPHFRKKDGLDRVVMEASMRKYEGLRDCVRQLSQRHNDALDFIDNPPEDCRVMQIAPTRHLLTKRTTQDQFSLEADYHLGRANAFEFLAHSGDLLLPKQSGPIYLNARQRMEVQETDQPRFATG